MSKLISKEVVVLKVFSNEIDAEMAQQLLQEAGVTAFLFKDDAGGMEPHLQRTTGVRLVVNEADAENAHQILDLDRS
jgi:Putative prokaryotic signal transducing protein